jgi:putative iron-regulated protein
MRKIIAPLAVSGSILFSANAVQIPYKNNELLNKAVLNNYANLAELNYTDSLVGAKKLEKEIKKFVKLARTNSPLASKQFNKVKNTWTMQARMPYGQSEIFRFYNGPIDFEPIDDGVDTYLERIGFEGVEGLMNAWPLDELYIDYVVEDTNAGLINNRSIKLSKDVLVSMNEREGEKNISTGYHAIEFLLWGQDRSLTDAGNRPYTDYVNGGTAKNQDRRRTYLTLLADLLTDHLESVTSQWTKGNENYRVEFLNRNSEDALTDIFTSMISMAGDELKSERIENAFLLEDQEEEHSCFSDQTINDIYTNALGVKNLYLGEYEAFNSNKAISGKGITDLVSFINPELDQRIKTAFNSLFNNINYFYKTSRSGEVQIGLIETPFDRAITENKKEVQAVIDDLGLVDELLREAAVELGLEVE